MHSFDVLRRIAPAAPFVYVECSAAAVWEACSPLEQKANWPPRLKHVRESLLGGRGSGVGVGGWG